MLPVGMARDRPNTWPKTRSQSVGWTERVNTSVGSRRSLRTSTSATASESPTKAKTAPNPSPEAAGGATCARDFTIRSSFLDRAAREVNEDVIHRRLLADRGLQLVRRAQDDDASS